MSDTQMTIEHVKEWVRKYPQGTPVGSMRLVCDLAISQSETIKAQQESLDDKRRLTRELDVAMHGEKGAAKQASLCDLIEPAKRMRATIKAQAEEIAKLKQERDKAYERAALVCEAFARLENNNAVVVSDLAATAIRALKSEPNPTEGK